MNKGEQMDQSIVELNKAMNNTLALNTINLPKIIITNEINAYGKYLIPLDIIALNNEMLLNRYWAQITLVHEIIHSTGRFNRLNRITLNKLKEEVDVLHEEILAHAGALILLYDWLPQDKKINQYYLIKRDTRKLLKILNNEIQFYLEDYLLQDLTDVCKYLCTDVNKETLNKVCQVIKGIQYESIQN
jgi:hypothetical protein